MIPIDIGAMFSQLNFGDVTIRAIVSALIAFAISVVVASIVSHGVRTARRRASVSAGRAFYIAERLTYYTIIGIGVVVAVSSLGVNMTTISLLAGAIGVGVGLGLQDTVKNFMAGIFLLMDGSIEIGDFIELEDGIAGEVRSVGPRVTVVVTNDNVSILVPNGQLQQNKLTNWTRHQGTRRIHIPFKAAYGVDKELVRKAAFEAAKAVPFTLPEDGERRTQVWLTGFTDAGYAFELVVWPSRDAVKRPGAMTAAYTWAVDDALRRHNIEIPAPQLDLRVRRLFGREEDEALAVMGAPAAPPAPIAPKRAAMRGATHNDAAEDLMTQAAAEERREDSVRAPTGQGPVT